MAVQANPPAQTYYGDGAAGRGYVESDRGYGWVLFAATLLLMLGFTNFIEGIAAISNSHFFVGSTHYIVGSLHT